MAIKGNTVYSNMNSLSFRTKISLNRKKIVAYSCYYIILYADARFDKSDRVRVINEVSL